MPGFFTCSQLSSIAAATSGFVSDGLSTTLGSSGFSPNLLLILLPGYLRSRSVPGRNPAAMNARCCSSSRMNSIHCCDASTCFMRLPFLLLSADRSDSDEFDPAVSGRLKDWLVETLRHLDWRSFVRSHLSDSAADSGEGSFIGELPGVGMMIALGKLVSKDELDRIRNAFPTKINRVSSTNSHRY